MPKTKIAPLDDPDTYYKYAHEAIQRLDKLASEKQAREKAANGLAGKAGAMGDQIDFQSRNRLDPSQKKDFAAGDAAYDALQNINESMTEDTLENRRRAMQKIRELSKKKK